VCWREPARLWLCECSGGQFNGLGLFGNRLKTKRWSNTAKEVGIGRGEGGAQKLGTPSRNIPQPKSGADCKNNERKKGGKIYAAAQRANGKN